MLVAVAAIVVALLVASPGVGESVSSNLRAAVCNVLNRPCGDPVQPAGSGGVAEAPVARSAGVGGLASAGAFAGAGASGGYSLFNAMPPEPNGALLGPDAFVVSQHDGCQFQFFRLSQPIDHDPAVWYYSDGAPGTVVKRFDAFSELVEALVDEYRG